MSKTQTFKNTDVIIIGVAGGSCSGKTRFAKALQQALGADQCLIVSQDWYYHDVSQRFDYDGGAFNFDHPDSIDFKLLRQQLLQLLQGQTINAPMYEFSVHARLETHQQLTPKKIVIIDGTLILSQSFIVELLDHIIFIDVNERIRLQRRLARDMAERGREPEGVLNQFERHVQPMHHQFVEPFKSKASHIVSDDDVFDEIIKKLADLIVHE